MKKEGIQPIRRGRSGGKLEYGSEMGGERGEERICWRNFVERLVVTQLALQLYEKGEKA